MNKIPKSEGFANTNIRTIYFNSFIQDIVSFFTNALFDAITTLKVDTKIPLYPIADKFRNKPSASHLIELLEYYRQIYYQNMWEVIALKPVTERLSENEMLLFILCQESTKQNPTYIQNIYSIVKYTYPFVQTKREIEMLKLLLRGAISYENKEKRNLLE